jgi:ABC-type uncharacterized transport system permease subunit
LQYLSGFEIKKIAPEGAISNLLFMNYIIIASTSMTASPPALDSIALPITVPIAGLLLAIAIPLPALTIKSPALTTPVTLHGTLPDIASATPS